MLEKNDFDGFRNLLVKKIEQINGPYEISLSGGVDSTIILFASILSGYKPRCITFYMDGYESGDLLSTRKLTKYYGLKHVELAIPSSKDKIVEDIKSVIPHCEVFKKTIIQCMIPWLYIYPSMESKTILTGLSADDLYCNQRKVAVQLAQQGEDSILEYRKSYSNDLNFSNANIIRFGENYNKTCIDIYNDSDIENYFLKYPAKWLNKPKQKMLSLGAFQDFFDSGSFYRRRDSYQVNSKLRDIHDKVLLNSEWNINKNKVILPVYKNIMNNMFSKPLDIF